MLPRERRLPRKAFSEVFQKGRGWGSRELSLRAKPNGLEVSRFGFVVSKRLGRAVRRNRLKRLLRESCRRLPVKPGWDLVFVARKELKEADFWQVRGIVERLVRRAGLLEEES